MNPVINGEVIPPDVLAAWLAVNTITTQPVRYGEKAEYVETGSKRILINGVRWATIKMTGHGRHGPSYTIQDTGHHELTRTAQWGTKTKPAKAAPPRAVQPAGRKLRLLDLFCCAGGVGVGYARAGFDVLGIDIDRQPNYPLPFIQTDALKLDPKFLATFDAIHASPPCQSYSDLAKRNANADEWPRLIEPVREMLKKTGLPYIIENVDNAPLLNAVTLCGTMFPGLRVLRHRLFEANFEIIPPPHKKHPKVHTFDKRKSHYGKTDDMKDFVQVTGGGNCSIAAARDAMGIDWMNKGEINESIPPAYTEFVGKELLRHLAGSAVDTAKAQRQKIKRLARNWKDEK